MTSDNGRQQGLYYGWRVVWAMVLIGGVTMAMAGPTFGLFIDPMRDELGYSRALFGWVQTGYLLAAAAGGLFIGRLIDRYGGRVLLAVAGGLSALMMGSLGIVHPAWWFVTAYLVTGLVGIHGPASLYGAPIISKWFVRQRARALGIFSLAAPIGLLVGFPAAQWVILTYGWREGWMALGAAGLVLVVPVALLVLRRQPEDMGLAPDGAARLDTGADARLQADPEARQWTRGEAIRTPVFWRVTIAFSLFTLCTSSMVIFRFPYFIDKGMDPGLMSVAAGTAQLSQVVGAFTLGRQVSILGLERLMALNMALMLCSFVFTLLVSNAFMMFAALYIWSWAINSVGAGQGIVYAAYYGRRHSGAVRSVAMTTQLLFAAVAGPLTGYVADGTGGYEVMWWPCVGIMAVAGVMMLTARPPALPPADVGAAPAAERA